MAYKIYVCTSFSVTSPCVCEFFFCLANRFHIDIFFSKNPVFHLFECTLNTYFIVVSILYASVFFRLFLSVNIIIVCITWCFIYYFIQAKCNEIHSHNGYPTLYLIPLSLSLVIQSAPARDDFCCVVSFLIHARLQNISHRRIHHSVHKSVATRVRLGFKHSIKCHSIRLHFILHFEYCTVKLIAIN